MTFSNMLPTTEAAVAAVKAEQEARQCGLGQHVWGCPHRPCSPFVLRALGRKLPAADLTGHIRSSGRTIWK